METVKRAATVVGFLSFRT